MTGAHVLQAKAPGKGPSVLLALGCLLLVALAMHAGSLLFGRVIESIDLRTHYQWSVQFLQVLGEGTLYPRWLPLANGGLGEPSFTIVHPAWYYAMALLQALGVETWLAMRLLGLLATWALGAVAFWWLRQRMPSGQALGVAVLVEAVPFGIFLFVFTRPCLGRPACRCCSCSWRCRWIWPARPSPVGTCAWWPWWPCCA